MSEEIDLQRLHSLLGTSPSKREPAFRHPAPEYVRYEQPPLASGREPYGDFEGLPIDGRIRYFNYGVASVELRTLFQVDSWQELVRLATRWVLSNELEKRAEDLLRARLNVVKPAMQKPYSDWISEDYYVIQLEPVLARDGRLLAAEDLVREHGSDIAQIVRGEELPLSNNERQEVLAASMSYYPQDLLVVGWVAAFVYDTIAGAGPAIDLLEYANTQLLQFRHYDEVLTGVLADVYKRLDKKRRAALGAGRWRAMRKN